MTSSFPLMAVWGMRAAIIHYNVHGVVLMYSCCFYVIINSTLLHPESILVGVIIYIVALGMDSLMGEAFINMKS